MTVSVFLTDESRFLTSALAPEALNWDAGSLRHLASLQVPERLLGHRRSILRADINEQWAWWFVESLADPRRYALQQASYPQIFEDVFKGVQTCFAHLSKPERKELASSTARILLDFVRRLQKSQDRRRLSAEERWRLLDFAGTSPRCWICGTRFLETAIDNFLYRNSNTISLPPFVDILKPRGLFQRDLSIEVDHIVPHSLGGGDSENLALACGWCNRHKLAHTSIYDVEGRPRLAGSNAIGANSLPQPFWTVRLLATIRACEHPEGCRRSADNSDVTVVPVHKTGALNPVNLRVTCYEHDPDAASRFQAHRVVRTAWKL